MIDFACTCITAGVELWGGEWKLHIYKYKSYIDTSCTHESGCTAGINGEGFVVCDLQSLVYFSLFSRFLLYHPSFATPLFTGLWDKLFSLSMPKTCGFLHPLSLVEHHNLRHTVPSSPNLPILLTLPHWFRGPPLLEKYYRSLSICIGCSTEGVP